MFKLHLKREKEALTHLISINKDLVFVPEAVCSIHPGLYMFSAIFHKDVHVENPTIRECAFLEGVLKSKEIDEMEFDTEANSFDTKRPYKTHRDMPEKDDSTGAIEEVQKRLDIIAGISELSEGSVFTNSAGEEKAIAFFEVDNAIFLDMLQGIGEGENVKLTTGAELRLESSKAWASLEFSSPINQVSIVVTEDTLPVLKSAFIEPIESTEKTAERPRSRICIVDESFVIITNRASTIINSMV